MGWGDTVKAMEADLAAIQNPDGTWSPEDEKDRELGQPEVIDHQVSAADLTRQKMQDVLGTIEADDSFMSNMLNTSMNDVAMKAAEVFGFKSPLTDAFFGITEDMADEAEKDSIMGPEARRAIDNLGAVGHEIKMFNQGISILAKSVPNLYKSLAGGEAATLQGLNTEFRQGKLDEIIDNALQSQAEFSEKYKDVQGHFIIPGISFQDVAGTASQIGFSLSSMFNGVLAGGIGTLASGGNPVAGKITGSAAMFASTYRQTANLAMRELIAQANADMMTVKGRPLNQDEWQSVQRKYTRACQVDGVIEAAMSTGSFIADVMIMGGGSKVTKEVAQEIAKQFPKNTLKRLKNQAGEMLSSLAGVQAVEQTEEASTQYFQEWNHFLSGIQDSAPSIVEAAKKTMGPTFLQAFAMGGSAKLVNSASFLRKIFITRGERKIDAEMAKEAAVSSDKVKELDKEIGQLIGEDHAEQLLLSGEEVKAPLTIGGAAVKPLESTSASNPAEGATGAQQTEAPIPGVQLSQTMTQGPVKQPKVEVPEKPGVNVPNFNADLDSLVLTGHAANIRDSIKVAEKERSRMVSTIEAHQIVHEKRWSRLGEALNKDFDNAVAGHVKELQEIDKKIESAIDARDEMQNDVEFKAVNLLKDTGDSTKPNWKQELETKLDWMEGKIGALVRRKQTLQKWVAESEWMGRNPDVRLAMERLEKQEKRIEELKADLEEKDMEIMKKGNRLFETMNTELFGGKNEVANWVSTDEKVKVKVGQLNRIEEVMWERQINAFHKGLKEGKRVSYKYAQQVQKYLARLVRKSKLDPAQKNKALNKILSIKNVEALDKARMEIKGLIREMRTAKVMDDIREDIADLMSRIPQKKNTNDKNSKGAVDVEVKGVFKRVAELFNAKGDKLQDAIAKAANQTGRIFELYQERNNLLDMEHQSPDIVARLRGIEQEVNAISWETRVASVLRNPSVSALAELQLDIRRLIKEGENAFTVKDEARRKEAAAAVNRLIASLELKYRIDDTALSEEQKSQNEKAKGMLTQGWDAVKNAAARFLHLTSTCRRLDLGYSGEFTMFFADGFMHIEAAKQELKKLIHAKRMAAFKALDDFLLTNDEWRIPFFSKRRARMELPSARAQYLGAKFEFDVRVTRDDVQTWRTAARDRIATIMREHKDRGELKTVQEYNELLQQLMAEEEAKFNMLMEDSIYEGQGTTKTIKWFYSKGEMIMIYLLSQNPHQMEALTHPLFGRGIPKATINEICRMVKESELDRQFAEETQKVWQWEFDLACQVSEDVYNVRPAAVEGYCPMRRAFEFTKIKFEINDTNSQVQQDIQAPHAMSLMERAEGTAPVSIDLMRVIADHDQEMMNYIATTKPLSKLSTVVNTKQFQDAVMKVLTRGEFQTAFIDSLADFVNPGFRPKDRTDKIIDWGRTVGVVMAIGLNLRTVLPNLSNIIPVMRDTESSKLVWGSLAALSKDRNPMSKGGGDIRKFIHAMSTHIKYRDHETLKFIQGKDELDSQLVHSMFKSARYIQDEMGLISFLPLAMVDNFVAEVAWLSAYTAAYKSKDPNLNTRPADHANLVVKNTQVIFGEAMLPEGLKGSTIKRVGHMLYSFFNQMFQSELTEYQIAYQKKKIGMVTYWQHVAELMKIFTTYEVMPALINTAMLTPFAMLALDGEEYLKELIRGMMSKLPAGANLLVPAFDTWAEDKDSRDVIDYSPLAVKPISMAFTAGVHLFQNKVTREDIVNILGVIFKGGSMSVNRAWTAWEYMNNWGDTDLFPNAYMLAIGEKNFNKRRFQ